MRILIKWWLQNFAHDTTAVLLCHVQKFVVIWFREIESQQKIQSTKNVQLNFNLQINSEMFPWLGWSTLRPCLLCHVQKFVVIWFREIESQQKIQSTKNVQLNFNLQINSEMFPWLGWSTLRPCLLCHVQKFVVIWFREIESQQKIQSTKNVQLNFNLQINSEMFPWLGWSTLRPCKTGLI